MKWWMHKMKSWHVQNPDDGNGNQNGGGSAGDAGEGDGGSGAGEGGADGEKGAEGGKPKLSDAEAKLLKENMQKKEALQKASDELKKAQSALKAFEGIDPVKVRELMDAQKKAEEAQLEARGEWDRLKQRMAEEHSNQIQSKDTMIAQLQAALAAKDSTINELSIGQQFAQSEFIKEETTIPPSKARKLFGEHFDVVEGKLVPYDKPRGEASRTALVDQYGNAVPFEEAMRKIVQADPDRDSLLRSKVTPGAGSSSAPKVEAGKAKQESGDSASKINAGLKGLNILAQTNGNKL